MNFRMASLLASVMLVLPVSVYASGTDLLIQMNNALQRMNYSGTLVHIKGNDINTLRVEHEVVNGVESETITSLNAVNDSVSSKSQDFSFSMMPDSIEQMKKVYSFDVGAIKKVAKRDCQTVVARPKDTMRYLQKYCIDKQSGLPLAYSLIDNKHQTVERFTFTDVRITAAEIAAADSVKIKPQVWTPGKLPSGEWSITELPKGFHFGKQLKSEVKDGPYTEHFVLTDGLSSISVFISPITTAQQKSTSSLSSGALNVLTSQKNNHRITLVGEVPRDTMQSILSNLKYHGDS